MPEPVTTSDRLTGAPSRRPLAASAGLRGELLRRGRRPGRALGGRSGLDGRGTAHAGLARLRGRVPDVLPVHQPPPLSCRRHGFAASGCDRLALARVPAHRSTGSDVGHDRPRVRRDSRRGSTGTVTPDPLVYRGGAGPAVIVIHEIPGLHPGVVDVRAAGRRRRLHRRHAVAVRHAGPRGRQRRRTCMSSVCTGLRVAGVPRCSRLGQTIADRRRGCARWRRRRTRSAAARASARSACASPAASRSGWRSTIGCSRRC